MFWKNVQTYSSERTFLFTVHTIRGMGAEKTIKCNYIGIKRFTT